jgi:hypothetical protein
MATYPLILQEEHLYLQSESGLWLFDTGAPTSFGSDSLVLAGERFEPPGGFMGLSVETLRVYTEVECQGLLGADIIGKFDCVIDVPGETVEMSADLLELEGTSVPLGQFMGIPLMSATVQEREFQMVLDTGASISYLDDANVATFSHVGSETDFFPVIGRFQVETHAVEFGIGGNAYTLRCGTLPSLLNITLQMAGAQGIIGNEIFAAGPVGYFPRRKLLAI